MHEELLTCRLCGGKVSSAAITCPHCGSRNFKPDSYLEKTKREEVERAREHKNQIEKERGPELSVWPRGRYPIRTHGSAIKLGNPTGWEDYVSFDGKRFRSIGTSSKPDGDDWIPTAIRLLPGQHTVEFKYYQGGQSSQTFFVDSDSHRIVLQFRKRLFFDAYVLVSVNVE